MSKTHEKDIVKQLGFSLKENESGIFCKKYSNGYIIEIDFEKETINYGKDIKYDSKTTQNFSQTENFVVLECVDRLLEKGYKPKNIVLEKTYPSGHGTSGRLDICVIRDDGSEYLLIECKTYGKEFDKEFIQTKKDGGQLFTYFKFSNKADVIMLYTSELKGKEIIYRNEIIKIEDDYRTGDVKDFYEKWNKLTKDNGVFDTWVKPYNFESKALTPKQLIPIRQEDSSLIFNQFLEILRHNVVSDKPNAFNKIFTLFLCKVYDEKTTKDNEELKFQWFDGIDKITGDDAYVDFLIRLSDLYKNGMLEFLEKEVTDFSEDAFNKKYGTLSDSVKKDLLREFKKIRLEKNNEFAIKEVFDNQSFLENSKIVKEVVELLQGYRLRYNKRQQYLSDFFELLLTTGLKQESGQFFTPVPIAQFIIKSLPIDKIINEKLEKGEKNNLLPYLIDYAVGSGHFLTESMHEIQFLIDSKKPENYISDTAKKIKGWHTDHFDWATQYIYGIEKDYRLVKVGKVGCYLHGDGLANVVLSDGLAKFEHLDYKGKLQYTDKDFPKENKQFDILISNPPYSVSAFKNTSLEYYSEKDFELYNALTANSSEIECLFVERTKQLLKDGGVAGIILPSTILSNEGIYSKAREIIIKYFKIVAITELGSNTFMATGTNTVVLFLLRRNNYEVQNFAASLENSLNTYRDNTINGIEKPINKYINNAWENVSFTDYVSMLKKKPNNDIINHEIYKRYKKEIKAKTETDFWNVLLDIEKEKLLYFILAHPQKVVLVKTGEKDAEKSFLGYEFSNRRGSEGIHPIQRGKTIDECTKLFDEERFDNEEKASTYIYKAFLNDYEFPIDKSLRDNVFRVNLTDMIAFDRVSFGKNISTAIKKKLKIESKWDIVKLRDIAQIDWGNTNLTKAIYKKNGQYDVYSATGLDGKTDFYEQNKNAIILSAIGARCGKCFFAQGKWTAIKNTIIIENKENILLKYLFQYINNEDYWEKSGTAQPFITLTSANAQEIPLPPKKIQEKILSEIEVLEKKNEEAKEKINKLMNGIDGIFEILKSDSVELGNIVSFKNGLNYSRKSLGDIINIIGVSDFQNNITPNLDKIEQVQIEGSLTEEYHLQPDDLLVVRSNGSVNLVGRFLLIDKVLPNTSFSGFTIRLRPNLNKVYSKYLCYYLRTKKIRGNLTRNSYGSNIKSLNQPLLSSLTIPLPSLSEQQIIVSKIEKAEAQIHDMQKELEQISIQKELVLKKYL
jgi:type I restriction enzyme M protein